MGGPFPAKGRIVVERGSIFRECQTPPNYVGYVKQAFFFLEQPTSWETKAVENVADAPNLLAKGRFRFPNFTRIDITDQTREKESRDDAFAQAAFISFLFALRFHLVHYLSVEPLETAIFNALLQWRAKLFLRYLVPRRTFGWFFACVVVKT